MMRSNLLRPVYMVNTAALCAAVLLMEAYAQAPDIQADAQPAERPLVLATIGMLERDPLAYDAPLLRAALMQWLVATPHLELRPCSALLWPFANGTRPFGDELLAHTMLASAAFLLQHPDSSANRLAVGRAGLLGCLRTYETILRQRPDTRFPELDELIERRDYGEFDAYLLELTAGCDTADEP